MKVEFFCTNCNSPIKVSLYEILDDGTLVYDVEPCDRCREMLKEEGRSEAYDNILENNELLEGL